MLHHPPIVAKAHTAGATARAAGGRPAGKPARPMVLPSWLNVMARLAPFRGTSSSNAYRASPLFKKLNAANDLPLYWDMLGQTKYPDVASAGFLLLEKHSRRLACRAALIAAITTPKRRLLTYNFGPYTRFLEKPGVSKAVFADALSRVAYQRPAYPDLFTSAVMAIPTKFLLAWLDDPRSRHSNAMVQSFVLADVADNLRDAHQPVPPALLRRMHGLANIPGEPRFCFVFESPPRGKAFTVAFADFLRDPGEKLLEIDFVLAAQPAKRHYLLSESAKLMKLPMPPARRRALAKILLKMRRREKAHGKQKAPNAAGAASK